MGKLKDLTGQRFGRLVVIERAENFILPSGQPQTAWLCRCDCGNILKTRSLSLTTGTTKSCGCLAKELRVARMKKYNTYDLSGEYGIGYTSKGEEFYFDLEDYDKIKDYCWYINCDGYVVTTINETHSAIKMHRIVMNILDSPKILVDHIYHNRNDNRKSQLRLVNNQQNQCNAVIAKDNTSGHKGVYWHKKHNKWEALITYNNKQIYLGLYDDIEDAIRVRQQAEIKYFGEYRYKENPNPIQLDI